VLAGLAVIGGLFALVQDRNQREARRVRALSVSLPQSGEAFAGASDPQVVAQRELACVDRILSSGLAPDQVKAGLTQCEAEAEAARPNAAPKGN
jgi:hypothetical protein